MAIAAKLFFGKVFHSRLEQADNHFTYKQFYALLKAGKTWISPYKWLKCNGEKAVFSVPFKYYGKRDGTNPYNHAKEIFDNNGGQKEHCANIYLLTQVAVFGRVFNPVSFWFYCDKQHELRAVMAEVSNTFKGHHQYFLCNENFSIIQNHDQLYAKKEFFVSPFFSMVGEYSFSFSWPKNNFDNLNLIIHYQHENIIKLKTGMNLKTCRMNFFSLVKLFFSPIKTIKLILWQAIKLKYKKLKFRKPPL